MAILANHGKSWEITETDGNGWGKSRKRSGLITETHGNGLGKSRKIAETALRLPVTTELLSKYGAKMATKKGMDTKK